MCSVGCRRSVVISGDALVKRDPGIGATLAGVVTHRRGSVIAPAVGDCAMIVCGRKGGIYRLYCRPKSKQQ